ncbi:hypothetical protein BUALT_Bualt18G0029900 [Buddleja alternifolia]|uniref:O-methyltransferase n=1 Tax=Buddleja alternifolia TaxID=168488 RepID=A0AAV6W304_9LAMI|nr:hypothetical protein BUALT_Bualt18G0029900 [Buddleja alternifolia]
MALVNEDVRSYLSGEVSTKQLLDAQAHVWNHIFAFIKSMSLKSAVELGIPDIIHKHGKPMTLPELIDALPFDKQKSQCVHRLMRILIHSQFFVKEREGYWLTPASHLLLTDAPLSVAPLALLINDQILTKPWHYMSEWLLNENHSSPWETAHGRTFWEQAEHEPRMSNLFNEAMSRDARLITRLLLKDCKHVFDGINSLVDVGGATGTTAKAIAEAFPHMKCTVLDLPYVVAGFEGTDKLGYVGGDMFETIPPADVVLLKWILHDWNDENCVKILKNCKEAIPKGGKVMIIDMIILEGGGGECDDKAMENQLFFDMAMMTYVDGKERSEKEWAKLFLEAGFTTYNITHAFGARSLIEVYH